MMKDFPHFDAQTYGSQGNAILGIRDSGKSYTAIALAEKLFDAGIPFVAFDPIGRWRFLRVPGHGMGYPVVVAGGMAADIPLTADSAVKIVRAAMEAGVSLVVDLYDMEISKADWRKIVGDAVRVLLYENGSHGLRHIFIEEAAEFAPQRVGPEQGRVYSEIEKLARMGGNARLGYTLINQRAEEVNGIRAQKHQKCLASGAEKGSEGVLEMLAARSFCCSAMWRTPIRGAFSSR